MVYKGTDLADLNSLENNSYSDAILPQEAAHEVMAHLMDYYIKLNAVVRRKLSCASDATKKRIEDIDTAEGHESLLLKYRQLDDLWVQLVALLGENTLTTENIEEINETFKHIPKQIKAYYDVLVKMDEELVQLIQEIDSQEYQNHYEECKKIHALIQKGTNLLSGHDNREYDLMVRKNEQFEKATQSLVQVGKDLGFVTTPDGKKIRVIS